MDKISGKNLLSRWPFRKWKGNNTEKTKKVTEVLRGRARTIYPNGDHCRKFDVNPVKGSKVLSGHFICAVHENQLRSSSLFSALWSVPVFIEVDFCQQRRYHEIEQKKIFPCTSSDPLPCDLSVYRGHLKEIYREVQTLVGKGRKSNLYFICIRIDVENAWCLSLLVHRLYVILLFFLNSCSFQKQLDQSGLVQYMQRNGNLLV